jgi:hypothetical protein
LKVDINIRSAADCHRVGFAGRPVHHHRSRVCGRDGQQSGRAKNAVWKSLGVKGCHAVIGNCDDVCFLQAGGFDDLFKIAVGDLIRAF